MLSYIAAILKLDIIKILSDFRVDHPFLWLLVLLFCVYYEFYYKPSLSPWTMAGAEIQIRNNQTLFYAGDTITGNAVVTLPKDVPLTNVFVSFHCLGEVKWVEYHGTPRYMDSVTFYDRQDYLEETLQLTDDVKVESSGSDLKKAIIPFSFTIPKE